MSLDPLIVNFKFQNLSNSYSVYSKSREVAAVYTKKLRMNVSGSTNREFQNSGIFPIHVQFIQNQEKWQLCIQQLRMNVSGSTNHEFQISKSFQFMFSLLKIKTRSSCVYKTAENECFWIH